MIVFAAVVPNSPILVKRGGKLPHHSLQAVSEIQEKFSAHNPDTVLIINQQAGIFDSVFTLPFATSFTESLKRLGFISQHISYKADVELLGRIQVHAREKRLPIRSVQSDLLDTGSGLMLRLLGSAQKKYSVAIIGASHLSIQDHIALGYELKNVIHAHSKRVAIIVAGNPQTKNFAHKIIASLADRSSAVLSKIVNTEDYTSEDLSRPLAISYGLLQGFPAHTKLLCDETIDTTSLITAILFSE